MVKSVVLCIFGGVLWFSHWLCAARLTEHKDRLQNNNFFRENLTFIVLPNDFLPFNKCGKVMPSHTAQLSSPSPAVQAKRGKMTARTQVVDQRQSPPLWPNSPQRCKHYMEEWPTDPPQRLQSEGQWFVQQPIRGVCAFVCACVSASACMGLNWGTWWGG